MKPDVTVVIPSIPTRQHMLARAVNSAVRQTYPVSTIIVERDDGRTGAAPTRMRGAMRVTTPLLVFLDDDDELLPTFIEDLYAAMVANDAAVVFPWFEVVGGTDPFPMHAGKQWDIETPHIFPITTLCRTEFIQKTPTPDASTVDPDWEFADFPMWASVHSQGGKIFHLNRKLWIWHHHALNSSGLPDRW